LLRETTTLGVRVHRVHRHIAERSFASVDTVYGPVAVKLKHLDGQVVGAKPEFEECVKVAALHQVAVRLVYEAAQAAAHEAFVGKSYSFS
jgi:uncharacterized protein (DUF111 family)